MSEEQAATAAATAAPPRKYAGADWLAANYRGRTISPLGRLVADLLGDLEYGLYHVDERWLSRVDWANNLFIEIILPDARWATFDFDQLTHLVVLCHDRCIRCELSAASRGKTRLVFHKRLGRTGGMSQRHPTMAEAVASIRSRSGGEVDAT